MRILRMMKQNRAVLTVVCAVMVMMFVTGCGEEKKAPIPVDLSSEGRQEKEESPAADAGEDTSKDLPGNDEDTEEKKQAEEKEPEAADNQADQKTKMDNSSQADDKPEGDNAQADDKPEGDNTQTNQLLGTEKMDCNVKSIGQDSLVVCKSMTYSDGDADMVAAPAPGYEEAEDLATVYVNENCSYRYKTVRNGGVNSEDVSEREGSFGDLKEGMSCIMTGSWRDGNFYADSIEMMEFV